jgi:glycerol-3-phosphate dehydrogenase
MATHLSDVVLRRTDLGSGSHPGGTALGAAARQMQSLLRWSEARRDQEIADADSILRRHRAAEPAKQEAAP